MNSINIVGNLVADAVVKSFKQKNNSGEEYDRKFCAFKIADNLKGNAEHTNYYDCVYFTQGADKFAPLLKRECKSHASMEPLKIEFVEKGDKRYTNIANVGDVVLPPKPKPSSSQEFKSAAGGLDLGDDEIPFGEKKGGVQKFTSYVRSLPCLVCARPSGSDPTTSSSPKRNL